MTLYLNQLLAQEGLLAPVVISAQVASAISPTHRGGAARSYLLDRGKLVILSEHPITISDRNNWWWGVKLYSKP